MGSKNKTNLEQKINEKRNRKFNQVLVKILYAGFIFFGPDYSLIFLIKTLKTNTKQNKKAKIDATF